MSDLNIWSSTLSSVEDIIQYASGRPKLIMPMSA